MVTTQDFPTLERASLLLQFDSFLLRAMYKVDLQYLLIFCGTTKKEVGGFSALSIAVISKALSKVKQ